MIKVVANILFLSILLNACSNGSDKHKTIYDESAKVYDFTTDGFVPDERTAVKVAEAILLPIYGEDVLNQKPFIAKLVGDTVWHVDGSIDSNNKTNGGTAHIEIRKKDCMILKVIHGK